MPEPAAADAGPGGWTESMTSQLIAMRKQGLGNTQIAASLDVPLSELEAQIAKLIREGALTSRRGLLSSHADSWAEGRERRPVDVAPDVAQLYREGNSYSEIASELCLTRAQVHNILTRLFARGLPKRPRHTLTQEQVRAIHALYLAGGSIDALASQIGFTGSAVRQHMQRLELPLIPKHRGNDSADASRARRP